MSEPSEGSYIIVKTKQDMIREQVPGVYESYEDALRVLTNLHKEYWDTNNNYNVSHLLGPNGIDGRTHQFAVFHRKNHVGIEYGIERAT